MPADEERFDAFKVTPDGRSYILDGSFLLAFQSDGTVDGSFGESGRVTIAPAFGAGQVEGEAGPSDLAVDSQGRLLVSGAAPLPGQAVEEAYVIRFLPDGSRDPSFGGGEVDTDFGLPAKAGTAPSVGAASITVDAEDRPVVGGAFGQNDDRCGLGFTGGPTPYVARLTATGALDPTFAASGHATLFTEDGKASSTARQVALPFTYTAPLIDPRGRVVELYSVPPAAEGVDAVTRCRPNGEPDPGFGREGRAILRHKPHYAAAIAVDARSRPIIALAAKRIVLRRYLPNGKVDREFGPKVQLTAKGKPPSALALDAQGRIYTLSLSRDSATTTIALSRFIPGR